MTGTNLVCLVISKKLFKQWVTFGEFIFVLPCIEGWGNKRLKHVKFKTRMSVYKIQSNKKFSKYKWYKKTKRYFYLKLKNFFCFCFKYCMTWDNTIRKIHEECNFQKWRHQNGYLESFIFSMIISSIEIFHVITSSSIMILLESWFYNYTVNKKNFESHIFCLFSLFLDPRRF